MSLNTVTTQQEQKNEENLEGTAQEFVNLVLQHKKNEARRYLANLDSGLRGGVKSYLGRTKYAWILKAVTFGSY